MKNDASGPGLTRSQAAAAPAAVAAAAAVTAAFAAAQPESLCKDGSRLAPPLPHSRAVAGAGGCFGAESALCVGGCSCYPQTPNIKGGGINQNQEGVAYLLYERFFEALKQQPRPA